MSAEHPLRSYLSRVLVSSFPTSTAFLLNFNHIEEDKIFLFSRKIENLIKTIKHKNYFVKKNQEY